MHCGNTLILRCCRCMKCGNVSSQLSTFYELDLNIQGHKSLADSLNEFLHEENLDGANRYFCNVCREKQDAKRSIKLKSLPPVLHLQLLRFVYDRSVDSTPTAYFMTCMQGCHLLCKVSKSLFFCCLFFFF